MAVFTAWVLLSVGCSIGFFAGALFKARVWGFEPLGQLSAQPA